MSGDLHFFFGVQEPLKVSKLTLSDFKYFISMLSILEQSPDYRTKIFLPKSLQGSLIIRQQQLSFNISLSEIGY